MIAAVAGGSPIADLAMRIALDVSPEQTARVLMAQRQHWGAATQAQRQELTTRWQALLAAIPGHTVSIPFAQRIDFPATSPEHRQQQR